MHETINTIYDTLNNEYTIHKTINTIYARFEPEGGSEVAQEARATLQRLASEEEARRDAETRQCALHNSIR